MRPDIPAYQVTEKMTEMQGAQAVGAWQHWMSTLYGLESDVYGDQHFSARLGTLELGPVGMTRIEASRHRVRRNHFGAGRKFVTGNTVCGKRSRRYRGEGKQKRSTQHGR